MSSPAAPPAAPDGEDTLVRDIALAAGCGGGGLLLLLLLLAVWCGACRSPGAPRTGAGFLSFQSRAALKRAAATAAFSQNAGPKGAAYASTSVPDVAVAIKHSPTPEQKSKKRKKKKQTGAHSTSTRGGGAYAMLLSGLPPGQPRACRTQAAPAR
eukprot:5033947-Prymnesium_polylepis.1